jgi:hypothetical protein
MQEMACVPALRRERLIVLCFPTTATNRWSRTLRFFDSEEFLRRHYRTPSLSEEFTVLAGVCQLLLDKGAVYVQQLLATQK